MVKVPSAADPLPITLRAIAVVRHGLERLGRVPAEVASLPPLLPPILLRLHALEGLRRGSKYPKPKQERRRQEHTSTHTHHRTKNTAGGGRNQLSIASQKRGRDKYYWCII